jgi:hypothetical protein
VEASLKAVCSDNTLICFTAYCAQLTLGTRRTVKKKGQEENSVMRNKNKKRLLKEVSAIGVQNPCTYS